MTTSTPGWPARVLLGAIRAYQGITAARPPACRYWPSCSVYAAEAIASRGAGRGTWLAVRRLGRCHPWGGHGVDPVPNRDLRTLPTGPRPTR